MRRRSLSEDERNPLEWQHTSFSVSHKRYTVSVLPQRGIFFTAIAHSPLTSSLIAFPLVSCADFQPSLFSPISPAHCNSDPQQCKFLKSVYQNNSNKLMVYMGVCTVYRILFGQSSENALNRTNIEQNKRPSEINKKPIAYFLFFPFFPDCGSKSVRR